MDIVYRKSLYKGIVCVLAVGLLAGVFFINGPVQKATAAPMKPGSSGPSKIPASVVLAARPVDPWRHPALKPLDKAVPDPVAIVPNRDRWINRLDSGNLYTVMNNNLAATTQDVYELIPNAWGGFMYRTAIKPRNGVAGSVYGSAMGVDEQGRTVLYYTEKQSSSRFKIRKAVDGDNTVQELPEIKTVGSGCWISNTGVAPNGSLWISSGKVGSNLNAGRNTLSMVNGDGTTTASQHFEPANDSTEPINPNYCLKAGVFDEEGNYYVRAGDAGHSEDDVFKLDLSEFPSKVTYSRISFPIAGRGQGLTWHDGDWWSAPVGGKREPLYRVDSATGMVFSVVIPGMTPYFTVSSNSVLPTAALSINHQVVGSSVVYSGGTASYEVIVENNRNAGISYSGPVVVDLAKLPLSNQYVEGTGEVVDAVGRARNGGRLLGNGPDGRGKLTWVGNIPVAGKLILKYKIKFGDESGTFPTTVLPTDGLPSNCFDGDATQRKCVTNVTVFPSEGA